MAESTWSGRENKQIKYEKGVKRRLKRTDNKGDITRKYANKTLKQKACHLMTFDQLDRPTIKIGTSRSVAA
jgi:hypothetical protein